MLLTPLLFLTLTIVRIIFLAHSPHVLGLCLLIFTRIAALVVTISTSSWFRYILFLVYVGGLLVIFAYFTALAPNQLTPVNHILLALTFSLISSFLSSTHFFPLFTCLALTAQPLNNLTPLLCPPNNFALLFLAIILFLALLTVTKISNRSAGPLRPFT